MPFQKELKLSKFVFVGELISTTTNDLFNRTVVFDIVVPIKGDIPDSLMVNSLSRQIVNFDEIDNNALIPMRDLFESNNRTYIPQKELIFVYSNGTDTECYSNSGTLDTSPINIERSNFLNYYLSESPPPPLKQINQPWNRHGDYICAEDMMHVVSYSDTWTCVFPSTAEILVERGGWINLGY